MGDMIAEVKAKLCAVPERAERIRTQKTKGNNKLYAMHAPDADCTGKG